MLIDLAAAWWWLTALLTPWAVLATAIVWTAVLTRLAADAASAKSYATETRLNWLATWYLPVAITPGSSPQTAETWHAITTDAAWSNISGYSIPQYRLTPNGDLQLAGAAQLSSRSTAANLNSANPLPAAYCPNNKRHIKGYDAAGSGWAPVEIDTTGVITAAAGSTYAFISLDGITVKLN